KMRDVIGHHDRRTGNFRFARSAPDGHAHERPEQDAAQDSSRVITPIPHVRIRTAGTHLSRSEIGSPSDVAAEQIRIRNFIDGQFVAPVGGKYLDNIEPATGKTY